MGWGVQCFLSCRIGGLPRAGSSAVNDGENAFPVDCGPVIKTEELMRTRKCAENFSGFCTTLYYISRKTTRKFPIDTGFSQNDHPVVGY